MPFGLANTVEEQRVHHLHHNARGYVQRYRREKNGWTQKSPNGKVRPLSAEQLLSHILPSLARISPASVRVEPDKQKRDGAMQSEFLVRKGKKRGCSA